MGKEYVKMSGRGPLAPSPAGKKVQVQKKGEYTPGKPQAKKEKGKRKDEQGSGSEQTEVPRGKAKKAKKKSLSKLSKEELKRREHGVYSGEGSSRGRRDDGDEDEDGENEEDEEGESHIYVSRGNGKLGPSTGDDFDGEFLALCSLNQPLV